MTGIIDRFEGNYAVVEKEDGKMINIERNKIPEDAKEGYVLNLESEITIDYDKTRINHERIIKISEKIWNE